MRFLIVLGAAAGGYLVGGVGGGLLISALSSNTHDVSVEAAMTGAFVTGPLGLIIGIITAVVLTRHKPNASGPARP